MEFLRGQGDILVGDGGSWDSSGDPAALRNCPVRALLVKAGPGKLSGQLRMLLDYALDEGYEGFVLLDGNGKDGVEAIPSLPRSIRASTMCRGRGTFQAARRRTHPGIARSPSHG